MKLVYLNDYLLNRNIERDCKDYGDKETNFIFIVNNSQEAPENLRKRFVKALDLKLVKTFRYNNAIHSPIHWEGPDEKPDWMKNKTKEEYRKEILESAGAKNYLTFYAMEKR